MDKVKLSKDIEVSSVCLGAMDFGTRTDEKREQGWYFYTGSENTSKWI